MGRRRQSPWYVLVRTRAVIFGCGTVLAAISACTTEITPSFREGRYVYSDAPPVASLDPAAGWTFEFADGQYVFMRDQIAVFVGSYSSTGDTLMLRDEQGLPWAACDGDATASGVYHWRAVDERIILDAVRDSCTRRERQLTHSPFIAGQADAPDLTPVPDDIREVWNAWFEFNGTAEDRIALLARLITDDAEFLGAVGREDVLSSAADFFCATGGRQPGSVYEDLLVPAINRALWSAPRYALSLSSVPLVASRSRAPTLCVAPGKMDARMLASSGMKRSGCANRAECGKSSGWGSS